MIRIRPDPNFADTNGTFGLYKKLLAKVFRNFSRLNSFFKVFMFWKDPEPSKQTICIGSGSELNYSDPATLLLKGHGLKTRQKYLKEKKQDLFFADFFYSFATELPIAIISRS